MWKKIILFIVFVATSAISYGIRDTNLELFFRELYRAQVDFEWSQPELPPLEFGWSPGAEALEFSLRDILRITEPNLLNLECSDRIVEFCDAMVKQTKKNANDNLKMIHEYEMESATVYLKAEVKAKDAVIEQLKQQIKPNSGIDFKGIVVSAFFGQLATMLIIAPYQLFKYIRNRRKG